MNYQSQVSKKHYEGQAYRSSERWNSYWHQLELIRRSKARSLLEVGIGEGVVAKKLKDEGIHTTTLDIAPDLSPDIVGSITSMPVPDKSFDAVLAAEVLEHIRFEDLPQALSEMARVAREAVIISIPHPGYVFSITYKVPTLPRVSLFFKIPFFWQTHAFNGQHYWELGKRDYSLSRFLSVAREAGLKLEHHKVHVDDPAHRFFLFRV